jgi:hypothetical protein
MSFVTITPGLRTTLNKSYIVVHLGGSGGFLQVTFVTVESDILFVDFPSCKKSLSSQFICAHVCRLREYGLRQG